MKIVRTIADLRMQVAVWRTQGQRIALVPTMGALHEGHLSLVRRAKTQADRVIVSLFVNPTQFLPGEDFTRYPRTEKADAALLESVGADLLYAPDVTEMYTPDARTIVSVRDLSRRWEGEARPGHFDGVATIVTKLLTQSAPDVALFGEKDYQQLQVIKRLAIDLDLPVDIVGCPIVRDEFGLALSSRNVYLDENQLRIARTLNRFMGGLAMEARTAPNLLADITAQVGDTLTKAGFDKVDYLAIVDPATLEPVTSLERPARLLGAVRLGSIRLLDNMAI